MTKRRAVFSRGLARRGATVGSRFVASGLQLVLTALVTQTADLGVAGTCLVMISWVQILSAFSGWGHAVLVMRNAAHAEARLEWYWLRGHLFRIALVASIVTIAIAAIPGLGFTMPVAILVGIAAGAQAMLRIVSAHIKVLGHEATAVLWEFSFAPTALIAWVVGGVLGGIPLDATQFAIVLAIGTIAATVGAALTRSRLHTRRRYEAVRPVEWNGLAPLGAVSVIAILGSHAPVVVAPYVLGLAAVAPFITAFRVASLATTITNALRGFYAPNYARAIARREASSVRSLLRSSQIAGTLLAFPLVAIIPVSAGLLDFLFGSGYGTAWVAYAVLAAGQWVNAATGIVGDITSFTGGERKLLLSRALNTVVIAAGWGLQALFHNESPVVFAATYSAYLISVNVVSLVMDREAIRHLSSATTRNTESLDNGDQELE